MTGPVGLAPGKRSFRKAHHRCFGSDGAAAMALRGDIKQKITDKQTSAIDRVRNDALGPGQRFAVAAIEVYSRVVARNNEVTIRWVSAHSGASGNEAADEYAQAAAIGEAPGKEVLDGYREGASLSHMTRVATEARSREAAE